jgi:hypothetical protein
MSSLSGGRFTDIATGSLDRLSRSARSAIYRPDPTRQKVTACLICKVSAITLKTIIMVSLAVYVTIFLVVVAALALWRRMHDRKFR